MFFDSSKMGGHLYCGSIPDPNPLTPKDCTQSHLHLEVFLNSYRTKSDMVYHISSFLCSYTYRLSLTFIFSASEQPTLSCIIHRHSKVPFVCQIQTFVYQQINEHFALMCGGTAWQPRVLFGQSCHLCLSEQALCNYLNIFCSLPLLFCQNEWKMNIENADNSDKNHRSHKLNTVETKMKSLSIPIMALLNPNQALKWQ